MNSVESFLFISPTHKMRNNVNSLYAQKKGNETMRRLRNIFSGLLDRSHTLTMTKWNAIVTFSLIKN